MRWTLLLIALLFITPAELHAQAVVRKSDLTVSLDGQIHYLHTVRRKETLYSIAAAYGVTVNDIIQKNPFAQNEIKIGQTLLIAKVQPTDNQTTANPPAAVPPTPPTPHVEPAQKPFVEPVATHEVLMPVSGEYELGDYGDQGAEVSADPTVNQTVDSTAERIVFGLTKQIDRSRPIKIVMMLPFGGGRGDENFVDFFRGATLAFDQISANGAELSIDVISTSANAAVAEELIAQGRLADADMIIGPVYAEVFERVAAYAATRRVPIISPLGSAGHFGNAMVVEVAPAESEKWAKLRPVLSDVRSNVILVTSPTATDTAALRQIEPLLPPTVQRIDYAGKGTSVSTLSGALRRDMKNVIVAPLTEESLVENLLSRFSSINVSGRNEITVVGTSRWGRFTNMNLELFFKLSVTYPTTYFFDRLDPRVGQFYSDYVERYASLPSLYSFRGYDVMMIFGGGISANYSRVLYAVTEGTIKVLQVPYTFRQLGDQGSKISNTDWALVQYLPSFRIEVL